MRIAALGVLAGLGLVAASLPAAAQSTTRIETRAFYGATVTMEEGVRVFRPLPPHDRIIINPDKVPLTLAFQETHNTTYAPTYNVNAEGGPGSRYVYNYIPGQGGRRHPGHHHVGGGGKH